MIVTTIVGMIVIAIVYFVYTVVRDVRKINREYFDVGVKMTDAHIEFTGENGAATLVKKEYPNTIVDDDFRYQSNYNPEPHSIANHMNDPSDSQKRAFLAMEK